MFQQGHMQNQLVDFARGSRDPTHQFPWRVLE